MLFQATVVDFTLPDMGLLHQPFYQGSVSLLQRFLHEAGRHHVAFHVNVFPEPEAVFGYA